MTRILILLAGLLVVGESFALPPCPTSGYFHNCYGTRTYGDGDKYVGEYKDDKKHGQGTYTFADGRKYVGEYKDDKTLGQGTFTYANGGKYVGESKDNKLWDGIYYSSSGQVKGTYSNGEKCDGCKPTGWQTAIVREIESSKGWIVRAGVFPSGQQAQEQKAELWGEHDIETTIESFKLNSQKKYRLYAGPFKNQTNAETVSSQITLATGGQTFVLHQGGLSSAPELTTVPESTASVSGSKSGWCATASSVFETRKASCEAFGGQIFSLMRQAQAAHRRLKNKTNTVLTAESDSKPTGDSLDKSLDLAFWQSIKDSNDSDMFQAYLRNYPTGAFVDLAKIKIKNLGGDAPVAPSIPNLDYGNYHALVIGNDQYQYLDNLKTPRHDAKLIAATLKRDYGFDVNLISNATRADMFAALEHYRRTSTPQDNLLIYYAGHGVLDQEADEGFWLPIDAKEDSQLNWIPNADIIRSVSSMQAKHVMVVADSCFSGTLIRALTIKQGTPDYLSRLSKKKARVAMTSGSEEPVTDVGGGGNSAFAKAFLTLLDENTGVMDGHSMFTQLRRRVMINTKQTPRYGDMRGHENGEFLFVRQ